MKIDAKTLAALDPLTRHAPAFSALRALVDEMVAEREGKHTKAAKAALLEPGARPAGLVELGALMQAKEVQQLLINIGGKQNNTEDK